MSSTVSSYSKPAEAVRSAALSKSWIFSLIVLANFAVCVYLAATLNIWMDEAYSLHTTDGGLRNAIMQAIHYENQAPLYFVILDAWRSLDHSIFFARLLSILCISLSLLILPSLARERRLPEWTLLAAAALNPVAIVLAVEIRVYALVILLATLLLFAFFKGYWNDRPDRRWQWAYFFIALAGLYTQYYMAFLLLAQGLMLVWRRPRSFLFYVSGMAAVTALFVPFLLALKTQIHVNHVNSAVHPSLGQNAVQLTVALLHYAFPLVLLSHAALVLYGLILLALLLLAASHFRFDWRAWLTIPLMIFLAAVAMLAALIRFGTHEINDRYAAFLLMPTLLAVYSFFEYLGSDRKRTYAALYTVAVGIAAVTTLWTFYGAGAKPGDWKRVAAYIQSHESSGQPILVFEASEALPLARYYSGINKLVPIPQPINLKDWDVRQDVLKSPGQAAAALSPAQRRARGAWLVQYDECRWAGIDYGCNVLDEFVRNRYTIVYAKEFFHSKVELLQSRR